MGGKVILITGAAGTGKSTLVRTLLERARPFKRVDYGQLLREHKLRQTGVEISYDELRRDSASVISPQDVAAVDEWLIGQLPTWRTEGNIVIDSHPVTKEVFGFRITPFSLDQVHRIGFDAVLVLVGEPNTLAQRIAEDPHGRPNVDAFQSGFQVQLPKMSPGLRLIYSAKLESRLRRSTAQRNRSANRSTRTQIASTGSGAWLALRTSVERTRT
jgi:adenylate kinase